MNQNLSIFENFISNPQKMEAYKENPIQHAFLLALYEFSNQGHDFADLPWFRASKPQGFVRSSMEVSYD